MKGPLLALVLLSAIFVIAGEAEANMGRKECLLLFRPWGSVWPSGFQQVAHGPDPFGCSKLR